MNITPRKSEIEAVIAVLADTDPMVLVGACEAEQRAALAKALIKAVYASLLDRDWYAYGHKLAKNGPQIIYGPFTSDHEAAAYAAKLALGGENVIAKFYGPGQTDRLAELYPPVSTGDQHV